MALPLPPINPNTPIPNNPFYYPDTNYIRGEYGPFIVGSGLSINNTTGVISASGGGGGSVTQVNTGTGLTGGPITGSGTISLDVTGVTPGPYSYANITVDNTGRILSAASGTPPVTSVLGSGPISVAGSTVATISIASASTTTPGAVQLYNGTNSSDPTLALTAAQGQILQQQIDALSVSDNLTLAGTFNASTDGMVTVTAAGNLAGFGVSAPLPSPTPANADYFVIATVGGTFTPPGPGGPLTVTVGDWLLSDGTQWTLLDVGSTPSYATTAIAGIVCLSTNALAQAGVDATTALTPAAATSAFIPKSCITAKGTLITGDGVGSPVALPVGTDSQVLVACSACSGGLTWAAAGGGGGASPATPTTQGIVFGRTTGLLGGTTSLGYNALLSSSSMCFNTAVGTSAGRTLTTGNLNVLIGNNAGCSLTAGSGNVAVGVTAGSVGGGASSGSNNVSVGYGSGFALSSGSRNTAIGANALYTASTGCLNTALGDTSAFNISTGNFNTVVGACSGYFLSTGCGNIVLGSLTSAGLSSPAFSVSTECNRLVAGHTAVTNAYVQVAWSITSDARDKIVSGDVPHGLDFVEKLEPKAFYFKEDRDSDTPHGPLRYGFLAQDILELEGGDGVIIDTEVPEKLRYNGEALVPVLVNAIKELSAEVKELKSRLEANG